MCFHEHGHGLEHEFLNHNFSLAYAELSIAQIVQQMGSAIIRPTHKPCCAPPRKIPFINPEKPFNGCQQSVHTY